MIGWQTCKSDPEYLKSVTWNARWNARCNVMERAWQRESLRALNIYPEFQLLAHGPHVSIESLEMTRTNPAARDSFTRAFEAINNLAIQELDDLFNSGHVPAMMAHSEIEFAPINQKSGSFYRHLVPLRNNLVSLLASTYRRCIKLALAHPRETGNYPDQWAWNAIQSAIITSIEWLCDWYILACDGENKYVRHMGSTEFVPGGQTVSLSIPTSVAPFPPPKSWRAPAWLFQVSLAYVGVGPLKTKNIPANNSEEKLGAAHTRLLLKGARRVFLWELGALVEKVRNEEIAAAGAIPAETVGEQSRGPNKRKGWEQKQKLYSAIKKALSANPNLQGMDFCAELDKRHAPPLYDWTKCGNWPEGLTWKQAWQDARLRKKIRRVRQEAMKRH